MPLKHNHTPGASHNFGGQGCSTGFRTLLSYCNLGSIVLDHHARYTEADVIPCTGEEPGEAKEREALRGAVLKQVWAKAWASFGGIPGGRAQLSYRPHLVLSPSFPLVAAPRAPASHLSSLNGPVMVSPDPDLAGLQLGEDIFRWC